MTQAFNLSQLANFVNTSGQLNAATGLFNQVPVANGGTGLSTVTSGALLLGAGTSAMTVLAGTTPGTVVASSPTGWVSVPAASVAGGDYVMEAYTSPATWTKPSTLKAIKVTVVGGGGSGGSASGSTSPSLNGCGGGGGAGGASIIYLDVAALPASPITITAGAGTNSFGAFCSATGGANAPTSSFASGSPNIGPGGAGGAGTTTPNPNVINLGGQQGVTGIQIGTANRISGQGGSSIFGAGALALINTANVNGNAATSFGSGGSGATRGNSPGTSTGGAGAGGVVVVEEFY